MDKNERYIEIPTHVGLTGFISSFSNVTGRVEQHCFAFVPASYDILRMQYDYLVEVATHSYNYNIGTSVAVAKEEKASWNK
jgi:hypothetical protein